MPNVLVAAREVALIKERFHDVLEGAGLTPVYPNTGRPGQLTEDELLIALAGVEATVAGSEPYTAPRTGSTSAVEGHRPRGSGIRCGRCAGRDGPRRRCDDRARD